MLTKISFIISLFIILSYIAQILHPISSKLSHFQAFFHCFKSLICLNFVLYIFNKVRNNSCAVKINILKSSSFLHLGLVIEIWLKAVFHVYDPKYPHTFMFPSGHTLGIMLAVGACFILLNVGKRYIYLTSFIAGISEGAHVYLGKYHTFGESISGVIFGVIFLVIFITSCNKIANKLQNNNKYFFFFNVAFYFYMPPELHTN